MQSNKLCKLQFFEMSIYIEIVNLHILQLLQNVYYKY